jgi:hypothetical protein
MNPLREDPMSTTRTRKPLEAVHGVCNWILQPAGRRPGILSINDIAYLVEVLRHEGQPYGFRLSRQDARKGAEHEYQLPVDLTDCDCPDAVYNAERPGGCKHRQALAVAIAALGTANASVELPY